MKVAPGPLRRTVVSVVVWCLVVATGSSLVWVIISGAGQDFVGQDRALPDTSASVAAPSSTGTPSTTTVTQDPSGAAVSTTWSGSAGVVTTRCAGTRITLVRALPSADGYVVEVKDRGPDEVDVEFEGRGDETVPETRVRARCVDGTPQYDARDED